MDGYVFAIAPKAPTGQLSGEMQYISVDIPTEKLGEKCDFTKDNSGSGWDFYGYFKDNTTLYRYDDAKNDDALQNDASAANSWVKVTKNSGDHNFTIEFEMTIKGKRIVGNYTGDFKQYDSYQDVGETEQTVKNGYIYNETLSKIAWAGYYHGVGRGYSIAISPKAVTGRLNLESDYFSVDIPEGKLGVKCDLSENNDAFNWSFYGFFKNNNVNYRLDNSSGNISGTDNWVKVTKNSHNNFTMEFAMTIKGKRLTGNFTGNFTPYDNYDHVQGN